MGALKQSARSRDAVRVFVAEGSALASEIFSSVLREQEDVAIVGAAENARDAVASISSQQVDMVLVVTDRQRRRALETTSLLRDLFPKLKILPLGLRDARDVVRFAEAGASGYVLSSAAIRELPQAIRSLHREHTPCSPKVAAELISRIKELSGEGARNGRDNGSPELTRREREVLEQVAAGLRNKEIALRLGISLSTVKNHVHRILRKLQVGHRRQAIAAACEMDLLAEPQLRPR